MQIDDERGCQWTAGEMNHQDVFEYEGYFYMRMRAENGSVKIVPSQARLIAVMNLKSGTCRAIPPETVVQKVHGVVKIHRNERK